MNETQIVYFLNLAQCGSFTETAYRLYVSQSAVSKQISALEKDLGCKLFLRHRSSLQLTGEGELYRTFFAKFIEDLKDLRERTELLSRGFSSSLNICVKESVYLEALPISIQIMTHSYPSISVRLSAGPCTDIQNEFSNNRINIIISYADLIGRSRGLKLQALSHARCQLVISQTHPLSYRHNLSLRDFSECKFFVPSQNEDRFARAFVENLCINNGFYPEITESAATMGSILTSVECGLGVAVIDSATRIHNTANFRMIPLDSYRDVVAAWQESDENSSIQAFMDILNQSNHSQAPRSQ